MLRIVQAKQKCLARFESFAGVPRVSQSLESTHETDTVYWLFHAVLRGHVRSVLGVYSGGGVFAIGCCGKGLSGVRRIFTRTNMLGHDSLAPT